MDEKKVGYKLTRELLEPADLPKYFGRIARAEPSIVLPVAIEPGRNALTIPTRRLLDLLKNDRNKLVRTKGIGEDGARHIEESVLRFVEVEGERPLRRSLKWQSRQR